MAADETLVAALRAALAKRSDVAEKKMFGGLTFMVAGHMCCGATAGDPGVKSVFAGAVAASLQNGQVTNSFASSSSTSIGWPHDGQMNCIAIRCSHGNEPLHGTASSADTLTPCRVADHHRADSTACPSGPGMSDREMRVSSTPRGPTARPEWSGP